MPSEHDRDTRRLDQLIAGCSSTCLWALLWAEGMAAPCVAGEAAKDDETLRTLLGDADTGVLIVDAALQPLYANPAITRLTGRNTVDLAHWRLASSAGVTTTLQAAQRSATVWRGSAQILASDGRLLTTSCAVYPLRHENGDLLGLAVIVRDKSEHERRIRLEAMSHVAGHVAHDLNNLLTVQSAYCQMLIEDTAPESPSRHSAQRIHDTVIRLTTLSEKLMLSSGRTKPGLAVVDLRQLVLDMRPQLAEIAGPDLTLSLQLGISPLPVCAQADLIEIMLSNLVANAATAAGPGGGISIEAQVTPLEQPTEWLDAGVYGLFAVSDTGPGVGPEMVDHLFEPFYAHQRGGAGTGLGLAVARGIASAHGGCIRLARSSQERGARFEILLPLTSP